MKKQARFAIMGGLLPLLMSQTGCHTVLGFSTATKLGLDISQRSDQMIDVTLGYDRTEVASIPAAKGKDEPDNTDASGDPDQPCSADNPCSDTYSVLGTFEVDYGNPFLLEPLEINQFFATGMAARAAAKSQRFQEILGTKAGIFASESIKDKRNPSQQSGGGR